MRRRIAILGAAGRDFHNFNVAFRGDRRYEVVAFTATQIPFIVDRTYPASLAGDGYPKGIPIHDESELTSLIRERDVEDVVFSYSDVSHEYVMHKASEAIAAGANFVLLGPRDTMLKATVPVVSVCAVRTGAGKSQTTRAIAGALKEALPQRVMAEGSANIWGIQVAGKDIDRKPFTYIFFTSGGTGARGSKDGLSATAFPSGVLGTPAEVIETLSPLIIEKKALREDSGGAGRYRGGLGQVIRFRVKTREPYVCSILCDRTRVPAQGFFGGGPGARGEVLVNGRSPANPKAEQTLGPDDVVEVRLPGGGGYGLPAERDPLLRRRDSLEGYARG